MSGQKRRKSTGKVGDGGCTTYVQARCLAFNSIEMSRGSIERGEDVFFYLDILNHVKNSRPYVSCNESTYTWSVLPAVCIRHAML